MVLNKDKKDSVKLLSGGNSKVGNIPIFNLPAGSMYKEKFLQKIHCPMSTEACLSVCYCKRGKALLHRERYELNRSASEQPWFVDAVVEELKNSPSRYMRIHSSGEFYSVAYFMKWVEIAKRVPSMIFLAFTRHADLPLEVLPKNFKVFYSMDHTTKKQPAKYKKVSYINIHGEKKSRIKNICSGACGACGYKCWLENKSVVFNKH